LSRRIWLPWKLESHVTLVTSIHSRTGDDIKVTVASAASRRRGNQNNNKVCFDHDFNFGSSSAIKTTTTDESESECQLVANSLHFLHHVEVKPSFGTAARNALD
jgi:hypothetical protein